jgi:membrane protease YdiL (CAAX protease family)
MKESLVSDRQPIISLFFILLVVLIGFLFIGPLVGIAVSSLFYEGNLLIELQNPKPDPAIFLPLMVTQGFTSLIGLIIFPALYIKFVEHKPLVPFFNSEKDILKIVVIIAGVGLCFLVAISPVVEWNMNFQFPEFLKEFGSWARTQEDKLIEMTKFLTTFNTPAEFLLGLFVIAILPGIGEELVFRGLIQNELWRSSKNIHAAIWTSAILFSAIHMQFFGFMPRVLLGALFGYLYYWSGNLLIPMIAHFFHNGFTLSMIYLYTKGSIDINIDSEESAPLPLVALCAVFTFALLYYFKKHYTTQEPQPL